MGEIITMSRQEIIRAKTIKRVVGRRQTQVEAAAELDLSERQVKRLCRTYRQQGPRGLLSKQRGKPSNHQLAPGVRKRALQLIRKHYPDFGPTLAAEKLAERDGVALSNETVRQLMVADGLWKPRRQHDYKLHPTRERRACFGELIQIDGSPHAWFEERAPKCTLLVFIDDATGRLMQLRFVPAETTFSYFHVLRDYIDQFGKPAALYSDKFGVFRVNQRYLGEKAGQTQFGRAMGELDIELICANSPQAKGYASHCTSWAQLMDVYAATACLPRVLP
jgi:transposase